MAAWLAQNWFEVFQSAALADSLLLAAAGFRLDARTRRTEVALSLTEAHRDIWERLIEQPELNRVRDPEVDLKLAPPTPAEKRFVQLVILHLATVLQAVREGAFDASPGMDDDIRGFLALPIPRLVAEAILPFQSEEFQAYLRRMME